MNRIRKVGLMAFLKGSANPKDHMPGCANYDHHYGGCLFDENCKVERGQPCRYFEKAVLPTANDIGQGISITSQYEARVHCSAGRFQSTITNERRCPDCGNPLTPRQRYCDRCSRNHRRSAARLRAANFRKSKRNALTEKSIEQMP
ncbi:MAG: hypothetical protein EHM35_04420 [Planctomycetaceae bacterium]|nr:MAG: hypothetical protein EHM35_04420 [Planctomycetaceae bacterium]